MAGPGASTYDELTAEDLLAVVARVDAEASELERAAELIEDLRGLSAEASRLDRAVDLIRDLHQLESGYVALGVVAQRPPRPRPKPRSSPARA